MQKITQESLRELNAQLDPSQVLVELGTENVQVVGDQVVADCPLEPGAGGRLASSQKDEVGQGFGRCTRALVICGAVRFPET